MSVRVLSRWDGFCLACLVDRPLVLTMTGPGGVRAWWNGVGWHDRDLNLTCALCGRVEPVTWDEADDPEADLLHLEVLPTHEDQPVVTQDPLGEAVADQPVPVPWELPLELAVDVPVAEPHHPTVDPVPVVLPVAGAGGIASVPTLVALPLAVIPRQKTLSTQQRKQEAARQRVARQQERPVDAP